MVCYRCHPTSFMHPCHPRRSCHSCHSCNRRHADFYENQRWAHSRSRAPSTWQLPAAGIRIMARQPWVASLRIVCVVEALTRRLPHTLCDAGRMLANRLTAPQRNATRRDCQPSKPFVDGCATNRGTGEVAMRACGSAEKAAHMTQFRKTVRASNPQGWKPELQWLH